MKDLPFNTAPFVQPLQDVFMVLASRVRPAIVARPIVAARVAAVLGEDHDGVELAVGGGPSEGLGAEPKGHLAVRIAGSARDPGQRVSPMSHAVDEVGGAAGREPVQRAHGEVAEAADGEAAQVLVRPRPNVLVPRSVVQLLPRDPTPVLHEVLDGRGGDDWRRSSYDMGFLYEGVLILRRLAREGGKKG